MNRIDYMVVGTLVLVLAACQPANLPTAEAPTVTPEVFIPLDKAIPEYGIVLEGVHLQIAGAVLGGEFPAGCTGDAPACTKAKEGARILSVEFAPRDLPDRRARPGRGPSRRCGRPRGSCPRRARRRARCCRGP